MASPDQPTAPYLDAVVAYGFRGSTRFHVPGHKAGNGADLGVRTAIGWQTLKLDIPQDIHGVDLGPGPTPFERAEELAGEALVVDQSWGPHFGFHRDLPPNALHVGADAMLTSVHKIAGSLTQSALLHVGASGRIDPDSVARTLRLMRSTSPSSLLMLSLDGARRQLVLHGEAILDNTIKASRRTADAINEIPGCRVVGDEQIGR